MDSTKRAVAELYQKDPFALMDLAIAVHVRQEINFKWTSDDTYTCRRGLLINKGGKTDVSPDVIIGQLSFHGLHPVVTTFKALVQHYEITSFDFSELPLERVMV